MEHVNKYILKNAYIHTYTHTYIHDCMCAYSIKLLQLVLSNFVIFLATPNIICIILSGTVELVKHMARTERKGMHTLVLYRSLREQVTWKIYS
jgi:hypothetical protein